MISEQVAVEHDWEEIAESPRRKRHFQCRRCRTWAWPDFSCGGIVPITRGSRLADLNRDCDFSLVRNRRWSILVKRRREVPSC